MASLFELDSCEFRSSNQYILLNFMKKSEASKTAEFFFFYCNTRVIQRSIKIQ